MQLTITVQVETVTDCHAVGDGTGGSDRQVVTVTCSDNGLPTSSDGR